ncbi:MAG: (2Fe-2S)-binding protein [Hyphomicrobiaceae bacterium]|nr:(2Fe-2S)-binding protein [Hyphomicrobiaceae bacterium]
MLKRMHDRPLVPVGITIDGRPFEAKAGDSVAAALLASAIGATRASPVAGSPRAPYCLMGVCFECLVTIDGVANRQACMIPVAEGMRIDRQPGLREIGP